MAARIQDKTGNIFATYKSTTGALLTTTGTPQASGVLAVQSIDTAGTIGLPTAGKNALVAASSGADKTGVILTAGTDGLEICLMNTSANKLTFAASGTSHVALGAGANVPALGSLRLTYDASTSLWY